MQVLNCNRIIVFIICVWIHISHASCQHYMLKAKYCGASPALLAAMKTVCQGLTPSAEDLYEKLEDQNIMPCLAEKTDLASLTPHATPHHQRLLNYELTWQQKGQQLLLTVTHKYHRAFTLGKKDIHLRLATGSDKVAAITNIECDQSCRITAQLPYTGQFLLDVTLQPSALLTTETIRLQDISFRTKKFLSLGKNQGVFITQGPKSYAYLLSHKGVRLKSIEIGYFGITIPIDTSYVSTGMVIDLKKSYLDNIFDLTLTYQIARKTRPLRFSVPISLEDIT